MLTEILDRARLSVVESDMGVRAYHEALSFSQSEVNEKGARAAPLRFCAGSEPELYAPVFAEIRAAEKGLRRRRFL